MHSTSSFKIAAGLFLTLLTLTPTTAVAKSDVGTDYVLVVDVSGSMSGELPRIRQDLKVEIATNMRPGDRLSLICYSGRRQCTKVVVGADLKDMTSIPAFHRMIDNFVRPLGMTAFVDPLKAVVEVAKELRATRPNTAISLGWSTDGQDNCYTESEILAACDEVAVTVDSVDVIEYGMWTNRSLLTRMAERMRGALIYVDGAAAFSAAATRLVHKNVVSAKLQPVDVGTASLVFSLGDKAINTYPIENGKVSVPDVPMTLAVLSSEPLGNNTVDFAKFSVFDIRNNGYDDGAVSHAYAAVSLLAMRSQPKQMFSILRALGDISLIKELEVCFGKQAYTKAAKDAEDAAFDKKSRWVAGFDQNMVPRDDAFTLIDLVQLLAKEGAELDDANIKFARIGPARVDSSTILTSEEFDDVKVKFEQVAQSLTIESLSDLRAKIEAVIAGKGPALKFKPSSDRAKIGSVVWNQKEANLSIKVRRPGHVDLNGAIPTNLLGQDKVPLQFETAIFRTRPLVASGIRNIDKIVVFANERVWQRLVDERVIDASGGYNERIEIDLARVPLCNMRMRDALSAHELVGLHYRLKHVNAQKKAYEDIRDEYPHTNWIVEKYGEQVAEWMEEAGIKPYGYSPLQRQNPVKSGDKRVTREMIVSIAGLGGSATVAATKERLKVIDEHAKLVAAGDKKAAKKAPSLTQPMTLIAPAIRANEAFLASPEYTGVGNEEGRAIVHVAWLDKRIEALEAEAEDIRANIARATFTAIVGQGGFVEFAGKELADTFELKDVPVPDGSKVAATIKFEIDEVDL